MNKKYLTIVILVITLLLSICVCIFLPETIAVQWTQWNGKDASNFLSKYVAAFIGFLLSCFGVWYWNSKNRNHLFGVVKVIWNLLDLIIAFLGVFILIIFLIFNLK